MSLTVPAPAKINLSLHITGKRDDGYHLLESLVVFSAFGDEVTVAQADGFSFAMVGDYSDALRHEQPEHNLALRAAHAFKEYSGFSKAAHIALHKQIPVGAGLGGGSADAAGTLRALQRLWNIDCTQQELENIAITLGADVPVCVSSSPAWMCGIGEQLSPCRFGFEAGIVLVNPRLTLPTKEVFKAYDGRYSQPSAMPSSFNRMQDLLGYMATSHNALEAPAISLQPVIGDILACLRQDSHCRAARMSGSGATCFGLYDDAAKAQVAVDTIRKQQPGWWVVASTITQ